MTDFVDKIRKTIEDYNETMKLKNIYEGIGPLNYINVKKLKSKKEVLLLEFGFNSAMVTESGIYIDPVITTFPYSGKKVPQEVLDEKGIVGLMRNSSPICDVRRTQPYIVIKEFSEP